MTSVDHIPPFDAPRPPTPPAPPTPPTGAGSGEAFYRELFDRSPQPMWVFDPRSLHLLAVNDAAVQSSGYSRDELLAMTIADLRPPEDVPALLEQVQRPGEGVRHAGVWRHRRKDGSIYPVEIRSRDVVHEGRAARLVLAHDATERLKTEGRAKASAELMTRVFELTAGGIVVVSPGGAIVQANPEAQRLLGLSWDELTSRYVNDFASQTLREDGTPCPVAEYPVVRCLQTGRAQPAMMIGVRRPDGSVTWGMYTAAPLKGSQDSPGGAIVSFIDVTATKRAEDALRQSEERYRRLAEHGAMGIWEVDLEGGTLYANPAMRRLLEVEASEDLRGRHYREFFTPESLERVSREHRKRFEGRSSVYEVELVTRRGNRRLAVISGAPVSGQDGSLRSIIGTFTDITDRKRAEDASREWERRFRDLLGHVRLAAIMLDRAGRITFCNPALLRLTGWEQADVIGRDWFADFLPPDARGAVRAFYEDALRTGTVISTYENDIIARDGERRLLLWNNTLLRDEAGEVIGIASIGEDITERRRADDELRASEHRYHTLAEASPVGIFRADGRGECVYVNRRLCEMTGLGAEEAAGRGWMRALHPEDRERVAAAWAASVAGKLPFRLEYRFSRPDGGVAWVFGQALVERGPDAAMTGFVGTVTDITDRKAAQAEAAEWRSRYEAAAAASGQILYDWDTETGEIIWGGSFEQTLGYEPAAVGDVERWTELTHPEDRASLRREVERVVRDRRPFRLEYRIRRRDGIYIDIADTGRFFADRQGRRNRMVGFIADITERKRLESELRQSQKMEAVGQLASGVAHDFNNLLTAIFGHTSLARRTLSPGHPANRSLARVEEAARQAGGVTRALLTFSREDSSEKRPVRLEAVVAEAVRLLRRTLPGNIELAADLSPASPLWVDADGTQLQQIVLNLAINARDAMPDGGRLSIAVEPAGGDGACARLSVGDTGQGMSPAVQARIFEPFFTTKPAGRGTGLGLPIVHGIVRDHGGRVEVRSQPGAGSTFAITLPCTSPARPDLADPTELELASGRGELILLADHHQYAREIIASMLLSLGYRVAQASTATMLLDLHRRAGARLLMVDMEMPDLSGAACLARLREGGDKTPVVVITPSREPRPDVAGHAVAFVLRKPFQMSELAAVVSEALGAAGTGETAVA